LFGFLYFFFVLKNNVLGFVVLSFFLVFFVYFFSKKICFGLALFSFLVLKLK
jgi:hypothetical protein